MASRLGLDGTMIPRTVKRLFDQRGEPRTRIEADRATLHWRDRDHRVELVNRSSSGAMVIFPLIPHIGEAVMLGLGEQGMVAGTIRWVRDGRIGINFDAPHE